MSEFARSLAVIIGIDDYHNGINSLQTATNDAREIARILEQEHNYDQVWLLLDVQATRTALEQLLEQILVEKVQADDRLLFYFAGHGVALNGDDGPEGYLIPQDAKAGDAGSYLPMSQLQEALSKLPCRHFLGILDCCFAGAFRWSSTRDVGLEPDEVLHQERYDRFIQDPAWQAITSAAYDQKAVDALTINTERGQTGKHSPFAAALIEALAGKADLYPPAEPGKPGGDGVITATELYLYLRDRVEPPTEALRHRQTPGIWPLKKHDKGEYIFLAPGHVLNLPPAPPLDESRNPYRGLQSFEAEQSDLFFGRSALTVKLGEFVSQQPLTVVLGASGSGKSSLVKAGLISDLKQRDAKETQPQWRVLDPMRPGESPFKALSNALTQEAMSGFSGPEAGSALEVEMLTQYMAAWSQQHVGLKLLLAIDQFEELITLCRDDKEREQFLSGLAQAVTAYPDQLRLVLTLRSDFEPQFQDTALKAHWSAAQFVVPPMTRSELREAIEEPASKRVMYFQSDDSKNPLIDQLINEVAEMPGALPLLSFTLSELYLKYLRRQKIAHDRGDSIDRAITEADYKELGGVARSLTQRADQEYEALVQQDKAYEQTIRHVMLRMVAVGGGELARRKVPISEFEYPPAQNDRVAQVIECFSAARLVVKGQDPDGKPYAEPAHDALVRGWQKLLTWKQEEEESLILQRRLTPAAEEWKEVTVKKQSKGLLAKAEPVINGLDRGFYTIESLLSQAGAQFARLWQRSQPEQERSREQSGQFLWNTNPYLDVLNEQLQSNNHWFNQVEAEFVQESVLQRRQNTSWRWRIATAVILGLSGLTFAALIGQREAQIGQIQASQQTAEAKLQSNLELDALISSLRAAKTLQQSYLLRLFKPNTRLQGQVRLALQKAADQVKERNRIKNLKNADQVVFSPDGQLIAIAEVDGTVSLWDRSGKPSPVFQPFKVGSQIWSMSFSPDSQQLITVSIDEVVKRWNFNGQQVGEDLKQSGNINKVMLGSNGKLMIFSDNKLRDLESGTPLAEFANSGIGYDTFSPDGKLIATGTAGDTISIWSIDSKKKVIDIKDFPRFNSNIPVSISFSPDSKFIAAAGSKDDTIYLWDLNGNQLAKFKANQNGIKDISFSPDGKQLATVGVDGTLRIWQDLAGKQLTELSLDSSISTISISLDGQLIAASNRQGIILWDLKKQQELQLSQQFTGISELHFSADNHFLALSESKGSVRLLNLEDLANQQPDTFEGNDIESNQGSYTRQNYGSFLQGLSFSKDGNLLAIGGNNTITVRSRNGEILATFPEGPAPEEGNVVPNWVQATAFDPSGSLLASSTVGGKVRLWNWKERKEILPKPIEANTTQTFSVVFSPKGDLIATAGLDGSTNGVRLWNRSGEPKAEFNGHLGRVNQVIFSPDGSLIATAGQDGTARIWDLSGQQLAEFKGIDSVESIAFSSDGKQLVTAKLGTSPRVESWQIQGLQDLDELLVQGCKWVGDYLVNNPDVIESDRHLCDR